MWAFSEEIKLCPDQLNKQMCAKQNTMDPPNLEQIII